jgi:energy-converting hydrogenase Eha subunit A
MLSEVVINQFFAWLSILLLLVTVINTTICVVLIELPALTHEMSKNISFEVSFFINTLLLNY